MSFSITGKTAIVTGAAHGVGLAIVRHFIERGANVVCADIDEARLKAELGAQAGEEGPLRLFAGDLRQKLCLSNLLSITSGAFDRIDILVNAARLVQVSDPLSPEDDSVEALFRSNVLPTLRLSQLVARRMIAQFEESKGAEAGLVGEAGAIVNLAALPPTRMPAELMGFAIAAGGVEQVTRSLALALAPHRIRVNAVAIGSVMTSSLQTALREAPGRREDLRGLTPLDRIAAPREVVETVQFLASEASSFITGQVLAVDGGRSLTDPAGGCV